MKRKLFILAFLLCALSLISDYAMADFYVIAGGRRVGTEIKSLPYTISSSGFYYITKDLTATNATGITVTADHVTLDLMGFGLIGSGAGNYDGVYMNARTNVEIRNGTIRDFGLYGIREGSTNGKGHRIINIRVEGNGSSGIRLFGKSNLVKGCTALENGYNGIYAEYGSTVTGNICYHNQNENGIYAGSGSTITGNTCFYNQVNGIYAGSGSTITGNTCYYNQNRGISAGHGSTITGNTCRDNEDDGIYAVNGSTITGNTCHDNTDHGIYLGGNNLVDQNTAYSNGTNINTCASCTFGTNHTP